MKVCIEAIACHPRILVVDDVLDNLFLLKTVLETEGYQVETADNGTVALDKIYASPPHLVLLDIMMPGLNGYEVTRRVRQQKNIANLPIILLTASHSAPWSDCAQAGADDLICKPIDLDELLTKTAHYSHAQFNAQSPAA